MLQMYAILNIARWSFRIKSYVLPTLLRKIGSNVIGQNVNNAHHMIYNDILEVVCCFLKSVGLTFV